MLLQPDHGSFSSLPRAFMSCVLCPGICEALWAQRDSRPPGSRHVLRWPQMESWNRASNVLPPGRGERPLSKFTETEPQKLSIPGEQGFTLDPYRELCPGGGNGSTCAKEHTAGICDTALVRFCDAYSVNIYVTNTAALWVRALGCTRQHPRHRISINQLNTRLTANYTMKRKLNTSQKLGCYFKSQLRVMEESWAPFLRGLHSHRDKSNKRESPET